MARVSLSVSAIRGGLWMPLVLLGVLAWAGPGCAHSSGPATSGEEFSKKIDQLRPGTPQAAVLDRLGNPDTKSEGVVPNRLMTGPDERVAALLPPGTRYRHWVYRRGDSVYHVFLAPSMAKPGEWEVASTPTAEPKGAAF